MIREAVLEGGPLHGKRVGYQGGGYDTIIIGRIPTVTWGDENPILEIEPFYRCTYEFRRHLDARTDELVFSSITPDAKQGVRDQIRKELYAELTDTIAKLSVKNMQLQERLDEYEEMYA